MLKLFSDNRNFRSLVLFSTFGGVGHGMFSIFMMWVVHALYQNPMYTGIAGFMFVAPLVASFIVGPFVDRWDKVKVLRFVELTKLIIVLLILAAHILFYLSPWFMFIAILIFCVAALFGNPAFTALLPRVVDGEDLVKANAFLDITGIATGLGVAAMLLLLMAGDSEFIWVYGINAVVLLVSFIAAILLRQPDSANEVTAQEGKTPIKAYFEELMTGFSFVKKGVMLPLVMAVVTMNFFGRAAYVNFPMFAEVHLGTAFGYVMLSALALTGSMIGSYICRMVETKAKLWKLLVAGFMFAGIARILFVNIIASHRAGAIVFFMIYVGFASSVGLFYQVLIQKLPPKNAISRVAATNTSLTAIATAIGALVGGFLGTVLDVNTVFMIQGGSYIVIGGLLCLSKHVRDLPVINELKTNGEEVICEENT